MPLPPPHRRVLSCLACALLAFFAVLGRAHAADTIVSADGDAIEFDGRITPAAAAEFMQLLRDPKIKRLVITSRGGIVSAALDMADAIRERGLDVEVPSVCHSSCANYIFPAGRRKTVGRLGAVAWHGNMTHVLYLARTGQAQWPEPLMEEARQLARRESAFFERIGVDGFVCWFGKLSAYGVEEFYYLSVADMARFGIRDVTVRDDLAVIEDNEASVRPVAVDWARLPQLRAASVGER